MKSVETYTATIYCGLNPAYGGQSPDPLERHKLNRDTRLRLAWARAACQADCDSIGLGLTFTKTTYYYTKGAEPGIIVGFINYPRFPRKPEEIRGIALKLAERLMHRLNQLRVTVVFTDRTIMLETEEASSANAE